MDSEKLVHPASDFYTNHFFNKMKTLSAFYVLFFGTFFSAADGAVSKSISDFTGGKTKAAKIESARSAGFTFSGWELDDVPPPASSLNSSAPNFSLATKILKGRVHAYATILRGAAQYAHQRSGYPPVG
jgi:hypothetical protein